MNDFDALLAELAPLAKAMEAPEGDAKIKKAASEAGAEDIEQPPARDDNGDEGIEQPPVRADGDEEGLSKSFQVTMPDGSTQEAYDGTEMMKAMRVRLTAVAGQADDVAAELEEARGELAKSFTASAGLLGLIRSQGDLIKSLQGDVARLGATGTGRKVALSVHEKAAGVVPAAAALVAGPSIMAKAMTAYAAGNLTSGEIARLESHLGRGNPVPADIAERL